MDIVDTALSPLGNGTSQPATESLVATLQGTEHDTGLDLDLLSEAAEHFRGVADEPEEGRLSGSARCWALTSNTLLYQVPGGMLSNLIGQLKQAASARTSTTRCWQRCRVCARTSAIRRW